MKMTNGIAFMFVIVCHCFLFSAASDTITIAKPIRDGGEILISKGKKFALGFFAPGKSSSRYVGIWYYNLPKQTIVWVANRDAPVNDTYGVLSISRDGNLVLHNNSTNFPIWSTNVSITVPRTTIMAQLSDIGNLVLIQNDSQTIFWQSFDHHTDTFLPYAKLGFNKRTGQNWFLQSWKSDEDPERGSFSLRFNTSGKAQLFLYNKNVPLGRVGSFNGEIFVGLPSMKRELSYAFNVSITESENEVSIECHAFDKTAIFRGVVLPSGFYEAQKWDYDKNEWKRYGSFPEEDCDFYGTCGPNGYCDSYNFADSKCSCLPGFEPKDPISWNQNNDATGGCVRKKGPPMCGNGEGFVKVESVKIPDTSIAIVEIDLSMEECKQKCLRNCTCNAYAAADVRNGGSGCLAWHGTLMDTELLSEEGHDLYVRVDAIELGKYISFLS